MDAMRGAPPGQAGPAAATPVYKTQHANAAGNQQPMCDGAPLPDITFSSLTFGGSGRLNETQDLTVTVVNTGQCASGKFSVKATLRIQNENTDSTMVLGSKGIGSLDPCRSSSCAEASDSVTFWYKPESKFTLYDFTIEADAGNNVNEFNEDNNFIYNSLRYQAADYPTR
jgi:hypothetical protein